MNLPGRLMLTGILLMAGGYWLIASDLVREDHPEPIVLACVLAVLFGFACFAVGIGVCILG